MLCEGEAANPRRRKQDEPGVQLTGQTNQSELHFQCHLPQLWALLVEPDEYGGGLLRGDGRQDYKRVLDGRRGVEAFPRQSKRLMMAVPQVKMCATTTAAVEMDSQGESMSALSGDGQRDGMCTRVHGRTGRPGKPANKQVI